MKTTRLTVLGVSTALLLGGAMVQAEVTDPGIDQRNQVWSMQGVQDGSYTGTHLQTPEQKRIQARTRTRAHAYGDGQGSRYGRGYESRNGDGGYGPGAGRGAGGPGRSGGQGGGGGRR